MSREDGELSDGSPKTDDDFVIDRSFSGIISNEELEEQETPPTSTGSAWRRSMRKRLLGEPETVTEEPQSKRRRGNACFNCRGDHSIANCPEPRDHVAIRKNRAEFQSAQQPAGRISKAVESSAMKYKPGNLSQSLRDALNLSSDDIPEWIYRMRRMGFHKGYPPGHLKNALKWEYENIKIFADGQPETEDSDAGRPAPVLDSKKVFYYNGFNRSYEKLNDYERGRFQVPPFNVFCDILQAGITKEHTESEKLRVFEDKVRRHQLMLQKGAEKEPEPDPEPKETEEDFVIDRKKTDDVAEVESPIVENDVALGESVSQIVGTPVISRRDPSGKWEEDTLPSLEAFSVGIVPFEAKEEEQKTGTFRKIMETLRRTQ